MYTAVKPSLVYMNETRLVWLMTMSTLLSFYWNIREIQNRNTIYTIWCIFENIISKIMQHMQQSSINSQ